MEEISDIRLIELFRTENDQGALHALISRYSTRAYAFAFRLVRDRAEAEDITQEAFIKAWKHIHRFNPEQHFSTWLLSIVCRTALDSDFYHSPRVGCWDITRRWRDWDYEYDAHYRHRAYA